MIMELGAAAAGPVIAQAQRKTKQQAKRAAMAARKPEPARRHAAAELARRGAHVQAKSVMRAQSRLRRKNVQADVERKAEA